MHDDHDLTRPAGEPVRFEAAVGGRSRLPALVAVFVIAFAAVLVVRPWPAPAPPPVAVLAAPPAARSAAPGDTADHPRASVGPGPSAAVEAICMTPGSWRTATIEQWHPDQIVRVWRAIDPRPASGPTDIGIDTIPAVGESVAAIGFCAPTVGPDRPTSGATVAAWRVDGGVAAPIELRQMAPIGPMSAFGALFAPPDARDASWPPGVYMFRYAAVAAGAEARWFGIEVRTDRPVVRITRPPPSAVMQPGGGQGAFFLP
jgi:hypothetical protein